MTVDPAAPLRFGRFELQPGERRLLDAGQEVPLGNRAFDVLLVLASRPGLLVAKNDLLDLAWPGVVVEENNLQVQISALRKVLGPDAIATIPGRGYRFTVPIEPPGAGDGGAAAGSRDVRADDRMPDPRPYAVEGAAAPPPLIGRADDLATLGGLLDRHRLVTLVGAGGIGKSALARQVASARGRGAAHGAAWVELAPLREADAVPAAIATALGLRLGGGDLGEALVRALVPLDLFLVLDNAEHLVDAVAGIATKLLARAPSVRMLVTSQVPLRTSGEQVLRLEALAVPPPGMDVVTPEDALGFAAVALFAERARRGDPRFVLAPAEVPAAVDIARRLDGMPLALELAAARVPLLGVAGVAARLDQRWRLLAIGARDAEARHRSLRALLDWSHDLLSEPERRVLRRLAVFADGFALELAEAVVTDDTLDRWGAVDALQALVDRSLVAVDGAVSPRYRLLESTQAYALERLAESGEEFELRRRHALALRDHFAGVQGEVVTFRALGPEGARLQAEWRNGQTAVAWAVVHEPLLAVGIVAHIRVGMPSGMRRELHAMLDATEAFVGDAALRGEDRAGWYLVSSHMNAGRMVKAAEHAERSFELYRAAGDPVATFRACIRRVINFSTFDPVRAAAALAQLRALEQPSFEPLTLAVAAEAAYLHEHFTGHAREAMLEGSRAAERYRACGDAASARRIEANLVDTMLQAGRYEEAVALGESLVASLRGTRDLGPLTYAELNLAAGLLALRRTADARAPLADAWSRAQLYGIEGECAAHLAWWCAQEGRFAAALQLAGFSEARYAAASQAADGLARGSLRDAEAAAAKTLDASAIAAGKAAGMRLRADDAGALAFGPP